AQADVFRRAAIHLDELRLACNASSVLSYALRKAAGKGQGPVGQWPLRGPILCRVQAQCQTGSMDHQAGAAEPPSRHAFLTEVIGPKRIARKAQQPEVQPAPCLNRDHETSSCLTVHKCYHGSPAASG